MATTTTNNVGDKSSGLFSYAQSSLDRVVSPSSRQRAYDSTAEFASARPILFVRPPFDSIAHIDTKANIVSSPSS
ncbi:hypothetical protein AUP68_08926 [Ilyonectria robusta]